MEIKWSDQIRHEAEKNYVKPAIEAGEDHFSIRVRDLLTHLQKAGFPRGNTPRICSALQTTKFLKDNGLEIEGIEGPPSKMSPTVVFKYRVTNPEKHTSSAKHPIIPMEEPAERAHRLTEKLRGILKEELAAYGGGEAFLRWVRSDDEEASA